jgi:hypothetical protein
MTLTLFIDERVEKAQRMLRAIQAWPHWNEIALCTRKEYGISLAQFQARLPEYQRFLALCAVYPGLGMTSEEIDQLWHSHILHTSLYDQFCETIIGHRIHHFPSSSYLLYGVDPNNADDGCTTCKLPSIPSTCYNTQLSSRLQQEARQSILGGGQRFREAYMAVFGEPPAIWSHTGPS